MPLPQAGSRPKCASNAGGWGTRRVSYGVSGVTPIMPQAYGEFAEVRSIRRSEDSLSERGFNRADARTKLFPAHASAAQFCVDGLYPIGGILKLCHQQPVMDNLNEHLRACQSLTIPDTYT